MQTTVIVTTYNRADYLDLILQGLTHQDDPGEYEIIVGDDGSADHTARVVEQWRHRDPGPTVHYVFQEDKGFRKAELVNRCVRERARGELLIFLDCDCFPDPSLVRTYLNHAADRAFYLGGVYGLRQDFTKKLLARETPLTAADIVAQARRPENQSNGAARRVRKRYWKSRVYTALHWRRPKIWGGNFAVNRAVFAAINGYDENYVGYGQEDSDIRNRLLWGNYRPICLHTRARTYHLWHPPSQAHQQTGDGGRRERHNRAYYTRSRPPVICQNGLRKLPKNNNLP